MTYEKAGGGVAGLGILNSENTVLTLVDRVNHHTTTGISTVEISSINAKKLNDEFKYDKFSTPTIQKEDQTSMIVPDKKVSLAANNIQTPPLPKTAMPNRRLVASIPQTNLQTGLTRTQSALLSPSEQVIARRT